MITPEIFGEILVFAANIREKKGDINKQREDIKKIWLEACDEHIKKTNSNPKKSDRIIQLKQEIEKLEKDIITEKLNPKSKEFKAKQKLIADKLGILSTLDEKENIGREIDSILNNIKKLIENESIVPKTIEKKGKKIEKSPDFIAGTAESILWAFFESKFTTKGKIDALRNFLTCLKIVAPDKINTLEKYTSKEYKKFENEIVAEKDKLEKITKEYDRSTYSSIKRARLNIVPAEVTQDYTSYQKGTSDETNKFNTCFESALLDTVSILLYDPKNKVYDLKVLPENTTESLLFKKTISNVFEYTDEEFINPKEINTRRQQWIDVIENRPEFNYFKYDKNIGYDFKTTIENFVKFLNAFYNLELNITPNAENLTIDITNVLQELKKLNLDTGKEPKDAQDFWNKIFLYVSEKLKTERRTITFTCKLNNKPEPTISGNKIEIKDSLGIVKIEIKYLEKKAQKFNVEFDLDIAIGHAHAICDIRKSCGITIYDENFKIELTKEVYKSENNKLFPLFILLAKTKMAEETDLKMQNLLFYCLNLKDINNKLNILIVSSKKGLFEDPSFEQPIKQFIDKISKDEDLTYFLLDSVLKYDTTNKQINKIFQLLIEKNPIISLPEIISQANIDSNLEKFIIEKIKNLDNVSFNTPYYDTILSIAQKKGLKKIVEAILKNPHTKNFDKLIYYINEIEKLTTEEEKKEAYSKSIKLINDPKTEVNGPGQMFKTPLHHAINTNNIELFKALLTNKKIDINKQDAYTRRTPITHAMNINRLKPNEKTIQFVEALLNHKNENGEYDIDVSIEDYNNAKAIDFAIDFAEGDIKNLIKTRDNEKTRLKLISEVKSSTKDTAINLLHKILEIDQTKTDAELQASAIEIIKNPEIEISEIVSDKTALEHSAFNKLDTISKEILNHPKIKAFDKLNYYIITGDNIKAIELIDDPKTEINGPKGLFTISLKHAVDKENKKIVEKLLAEKDVDVQSCLSLAVERSEEILELILKDKRTNINADLMGGQTALDLADMFNMTKNMELLKKYGAKSGFLDEKDGEDWFF